MYTIVRRSNAKYGYLSSHCCEVSRYILCLQMPLVTIAADNNVREKRLQDVHNFCSPQLVSCASIF